MKHWHTLLKTALAAGAILLVVGCASANPPSDSASGAGSSGRECRQLTTSDIQAITGTAVQAVERGATPGAGGLCGNYATADGQGYLGVNALTSSADYTSAVKQVPADIYPVKEGVVGLGDEAVLFKDKNPASIRYLVARQGNAGVVLFPLTKSITDDQLKSMAAKALATP